MSHYEREYYSIESEYDLKVLHYHGYTWQREHTPGLMDEPDWASTEVSWCRAPLKQVLAYGLEKWIEDIPARCEQAQQDLTFPELQELLDTYYDGEPGEELPFEEINMDTPCGDYWTLTEVW